MQPSLPHLLDALLAGHRHHHVVDITLYSEIIIGSIAAVCCPHVVPQQGGSLMLVRISGTRGSAGCTEDCDHHKAIGLQLTSEESPEQSRR